MSDVRVDYLPRNDHVLIQVVGDRNLVTAVGPSVDDLRPGDYVTLPDLDDDPESTYHHTLDEDGTLLLVREYLILAIEKPTSFKGPRNAYEDFHS